MRTVAILMAVYEPKLDWLREQLLSLNRQTYGALRLYIREDACPTFSFEKLVQLVTDCVTAFPFTCRQNEHNLGSNRTFGLLTQEAEGDYFAYCDQDDVWEDTKLEELVKAMEGGDAQLAYCDLSVIDGMGKPVASSIANIKPHIVYRSGTNLAPCFLTTNFVTGCALLIRSNTARDALPFLRWTVHDQWLGMFAASRGKVVGPLPSLVRYRLHHANQTHTLAHVRTKQDYYECKILSDHRRVAEYCARIDLGTPQRRAEAWMAARIALWRRERGAFRRLLALRHVNLSVTCFELALPWMPGALFRAVLRAIQRGAL